MASANAPVLQSQSIYVEQEFNHSKELKIAVERAFLKALRSCRISGSGGNQRFFVCVGRRLEGSKEVGCRAHVRAYRTCTGNRWKVKAVSLKHENCVGKQKGASVAAVSSMISTLVGADSRVKGTAIRNIIKAQTGIDIHVRSVLRGKKKALQAAESDIAEGYAVLSPFLSGLQSSSPGTITSTEVRLFFTHHYVYVYLHRKSQIHNS